MPAEKSAKKGAAVANSKQPSVLEYFKRKNVAATSAAASALIAAPAPAAAGGDVAQPNLPSSSSAMPGQNPPVDRVCSRHKCKEGKRKRDGTIVSFTAKADGTLYRECDGCRGHTAEKNPSTTPRYASRVFITILTFCSPLSCDELTRMRLTWLCADIWCQLRRLEATPCHWMRRRTSGCRPSQRTRPVKIVDTPSLKAVVPASLRRLRNDPMPRLGTRSKISSYTVSVASGMFVLCYILFLLFLL